jgi:acyl dehydratase
MSDSGAGTTPEPGCTVPRVSATLAELPGLVGTEIGPSEWRRVTQDEVSRFADVTEDHNPVHIDPEFAAGTPFRTTIVHGYFTLSLVVPLMAEIFEVTGVGTAVNYGLDRLRFPAPVPVGALIRAKCKPTAATVLDGGIQLHVTTTIEVQGSTKPAAVAEMLLRYYA